MLWIDPPRGGSRPSLALGKAAFGGGSRPALGAGRYPLIRKDGGLA